MREPPTRLCVLADSYLTGYQVRSLEHAVRNTGVDIEMVVVNEPEDPDYAPEAEAAGVNDGLGLHTARLFFDVLARERAWTFVIVEKKIAEELTGRLKPSRRVHVDDVAVFDDATMVRVTPLSDGSWNRLPPVVAERVGESADVAVRYGFGLLEGEVLDAPEYGVLSFHPADIRQYRGLGPPQAYLDGRERMGVTLQRLTDEIDAGEIVAFDEIDVDEGATLWELYDRLNDLQTTLLSVGIENLRDASVETTVPASLGPYYSTKNRREASFAGQVLLENVRRYLRG